MTEYRFTDIPVFIHGRHVLSDGRYAFDWTNSGLSLSFRAQRAAVTFASYTPESGEPCYIRAELHCAGGETRVEKHAVFSGKECIILDSLGDGVHQLKLTRITEGRDLIAFNTIRLYGEDTEVLEPITPKGPKIEVFGDSVICGHGILSDYTPDYIMCENDASAVFTETVSRQLDADTRYVAVSGEGAVFKWDGTPGYPMSQALYHESKTTREPHDFSDWTPDIVVTELGGNDQSKVKPEVYLPLFADFIRDIRAHYPKAPIIWLYPMMYNDHHADELGEMLSKLNEELGNIRFVNTIPAPREEFAAGAHPNTVSHARFAENLLEAIREFI